MDPWLIVFCLSQPPVQVDVPATWHASALAPVVAPAAAWPAAMRARQLLAETRLPLGRRVAAAMALGAVDASFAAVLASAVPLSGDAQLDLSLTAWAEAEARRLGLSVSGPLLVIAPEGPRPAQADERSALADVQDLLAGLPWPRWRGPLVLVGHGVVHPALAPGRARVLRPALPVLRIPPGGRPELAAAITDLALSLSAPPDAGWPRWLASGLAGAARARASGRTLTPDTARAVRVAAGAAAIRALFADPAPDPALAAALVTPLVHPARVHRLADLLQMLHQGATSEGALATAYGLTPEQLADPQR